jgi:cobalt-zinc-cadmium efflux system outer membrane protein
LQQFLRSRLYCKQVAISGALTLKPLWKRLGIQMPLQLQTVMKPEARTSITDSKAKMLLRTVFILRLQTSRQLQNVGQADVPDVLEIEIEEQNAELALMSARNEQRQVWVQLSSAVGNPNLPMSTLEGNLEQIPVIDAQQTLAKLLAESPEVKVANADIARAEFALQRARREAIPDLSVRGGIHYNRELLEAGRRPIGKQGSIEVGIRLPLFNRNQGNVEAARADLERVQRETDRVALSLRSRLAVALRQFEDSRNIVEKYRDQMLPRAQRAYELYLTRFRQMAAAYPQALIAQRTLLQLQGDYDDALADLWQRVAEVEGLLLEGDLQMPGERIRIGTTAGMEQRD